MLVPSCSHSLFVLFRYVRTAAKNSIFPHLSYRGSLAPTAVTVKADAGPAAAVAATATKDTPTGRISLTVAPPTPVAGSAADAAPAAGGVMFDFLQTIQTPGTLAAGEAVKKMAAYYSVQFNGTAPAQKAERVTLIQKLSMLLPQRDVWQLVRSIVRLYLLVDRVD